ncbi:MAG: hypothetical protein M1839_005669 [Geoglossum umbratile]|nr:MAG: hypothetical protein M1839_005669 [Geoglossum umbratile]
MDAGSTSLVLGNSIPGWFCATSSPYTIVGDPAREAYDDAVKLFNEQLTSDELNRLWLPDKVDIHQVHQAVLAAKDAYDVKSQRSKTQKWLTKLSTRVMYYSNIMDTLAQHHPEYVALAWGTMKFLFVNAYSGSLEAVMNHDELLAQLCKALSQIADALPRINLKLLLYPTERIKSAVATLYAQVIEFFRRAMNWYAEGKIKHVISSIIRPYALRFKDLVEEMENCSRNVDQLAVAAAQAEQRDMHLLLIDTKRIIIASLENQAINSRLFLDSTRRICEIQFSQILTFAATTSLPNPEESFRHCQFLSNRRRLRITPNANPPWRSRKLQEWASARSCSFIMVKGSFITRHEAKDFASDMVSLLRQIKIPVVWTLSARAEWNSGWRSPVDVLKQLVLQVLHANRSLLAEQSSALNATRFQCATTELEWFELLTSVLSGIPQIYVVVDAEIMNPDFGSQVSWPNAFLKLFDDLVARGSKTIVKVVMISFRATPSMLLSIPTAVDKMTIRIDSDRRSSTLRRKPHYRSTHTTRQRQGSEVLRPFLLQSVVS